MAATRFGGPVFELDLCAEVLMRTHSIIQSQVKLHMHTVI